jgi:RNA polymerase sigma factor (sigma-70 family)
MDCQSLPFPDLLREAVNGSKDAARLLHERYASHLKRVIRKRLAIPLRRFFDSHDFLQDVWVAFYAAPPAPDAFRQSEQLVRYLASIATHKVTDAFRQRLQTAKNNANRQVALDEIMQAQREEPAARTPTPSELIVEREQWERLVAGQTPQNRWILELLRDGYTHEQVAQVVNISPKTVQRLVQTLAPRVHT